MMTYYDQASGRRRVKRRYKYAVIAFGLGLIAGALLGRLI